MNQATFQGTSPAGGGFLGFSMADDAARPAKRTPPGDALIGPTANLAAYWPVGVGQFSTDMPLRRWRGTPDHVTVKS
jgi:hypothetical protein